MTRHTLRTAVLGLIAVVAIAIPPAVKALDVHPMTTSDVDEWVSMPAKTLRATLANKTIRIEVTSRAVGHHRPILGTGSLVLFTAPGGKLLWWTPKYKTVQTGVWTSMTLMEGWELPCFKFDATSGRTDCYFGGAANYREWTAGNPLKLKAGMELKAGSGSLSSLANKIGTE